MRTFTSCAGGSRTSCGNSSNGRAARTTSAAHLIGSECYIPALDYITKDGPHKTWRWAFERQWLFYAVWGHLLYDPATPDTRFEAMLDARFGNGVGRNLMAAWKLASRVPLQFVNNLMGPPAIATVLHGRILVLDRQG